MVDPSGALVVQKDKKVNQNVPLPVMFIGSISIYLMAVPIIWVDFFLVQYQMIYFSIMGIPKINRNEYVVMDRNHLKGLNWKQKLNCIYCEYANGMIEFAKAVANQTEIYSCAIKHNLTTKGQEHQGDFYPYEDFLNPVNGK